MGYGNLFSELSRYAGAAQARDIAEREKLQAQKTAFSEMLPLHQEAARTQALLGQEMDIAKEQRAAVTDAAAREHLAKFFGPVLEANMPPVPTGRELAPPQTSEYGPRAPVAETHPYKLTARPPAVAYNTLLDFLAAQEKTKKPAADAFGKGLLGTIRRGIYANPSYSSMPEAEKEALAEKEYIKAQGNIAGAQAGPGGRGGVPPEVTSEEAKGIRGAELGLRKIAEIEELVGSEQAPGAGAQYLGPVAPAISRSTSVSSKRLVPEWMGGGLTGTQADMEAVSASVLNAIAVSQAGLAQTESEIRRQKKEVPTTDDNPTEFRRKLALTKKNISQNLAAQQERFTQPRIGGSEDVQYDARGNRMAR